MAREDFAGIDTEQEQRLGIKRCLCGKTTTKTCGELWPEVSLVRCTEPLCNVACTAHRHAAGSMGYPGTMKGATRYVGDEPDEPGFIEWCKSRYRAFFWSAQKKASRVYEEVCANFSPPAPWPYLQLQVGRRIFEAHGPKGMVEVTKWTEQLPRRG